MMVNHQEFSQLGVENIHAYGKKNYVLYDLKCIFTKNDSDIRL
jgi:UDP-N-acetyl-D-galactosamine dehydrogenase